MGDNAQHYRAVMLGKRNRAAGAQWEALIERSCEHYRELGMADIDKTPEPMKPIQQLGQGKFIAYFAKKAQPDYKGSLRGGRAIVFEAKHTDDNRLKQEVVSSEQEKKLDSHSKLGAECFVLVSFGFQQFFRVPWATFKNMKQIYGRKYIKPEDLAEFKVPYVGGVLRFLG